MAYDGGNEDPRQVDTGRGPLGRAAARGKGCSGGQDLYALKRTFLLGVKLGKWVPGLLSSGV